MEHKSHQVYQSSVKRKTTAYEELRAREIHKIEVRKLRELLDEKPSDISKPRDLLT